MISPRVVAELILQVGLLVFLHICMGILHTVVITDAHGSRDNLMANDL